MSTAETETAEDRADNSVDLLPFEDVWGMPPASISWDVKPPYSIQDAVVISQEVAQQQDINTRKPLVWEDGRPRKKIIITLATSLRDPENPGDDGRRQLHVKIPSGLFAAIRDALKAAELRTLANGNILSVTYTDDTPPTKRGMSPTKNFIAFVDTAKSGEAPF